MTVVDVIDTPVGPLRLVADDAGLRRIEFAGGRGHGAPAPDEAHSPARLATAAGQLREWFAGARRAFDLPLAPVGTPFQRAVWRELLAIPFGETLSYGELARRLGDPAATRAVGAANGRNPLPIVIPCHRVIGADGSLTGFGGGLATKRWLLAHERALVRGDLFGGAPG